MPRDHHAQIDNLKSITLQHNANDILADVMHVALDGRHDDLALALRADFFLSLDVREQMRDRFFHNARRFHDLRQEHFARPEQVANDIHAVHQRAFDNLDRPATSRLDRQSRFFGVVDNMRINALDQGMLKPLLDLPAAPFGLGLFLRYIRTAIFLGQGDEALGGIGVAVEDHIFARHPQFRIDIVIDIQLTCVNDRHVQAGRDRMI